MTAASLRAETALACCHLLGTEAGAYAEIDGVRRRHLIEGDELSLDQLVAAGRDFGLKLEPARTSLEALVGVPFQGPALVQLQNRAMVVLHGVRQPAGDQFIVSDPAFEEGRRFAVDRARFERSFDGLVLWVRALDAAEASKRIGFRWFAQRLFAERKILRDILLAALAMQAAALAVPLFFQVLIDRVLPDRAAATLVSLAAGVGLLVLFDAVFSFFRNYLLAYLTRRLDYVIAESSVRHILQLPMHYFQSTRVGVISFKLQEAYNVRDFLANRLFNLFIDLGAAVLFLPVLLIYSWRLTLVTLAVAFAAFTVLAIASRHFRGALQRLNAVEGLRRATLVEYLNGILTLKSLALEPRSLRRWRRMSVDAANYGLEAGRIGATARAVMSALERGLVIAIGVIGTYLVLEDRLTIGALIAFNMLSVRVSGPLINAAGLLQDYQKALLSLRLFNDVMSVEPEPERPQSVPRIKGDIAFEDVTFHYPGRQRAALKSVSFEIKAGQSVGIVGKSGSGKTTITRLVQGLFHPQSGLVRVDGLDVKELDPGGLRAQIGIVLQENFLFRASVRENIAIARPQAPLEEVVRAAQLAGAHEFIEHLPDGYATLLDESGSNLSGGQRQRLAIARALITEPPVLLFDEATSALDPETEAIVQARLASIARGRTTLIVTHRLSFVRDADVIFYLEDGEIVASGPHQALLRSCQAYRRLWDHQGRAFA